MNLHQNFKNAVFVVLISLFSTIAFAQTGKISGKVTDKVSGEKLVGLSVFIEGTSIGATTDADGAYSLNTIKAGTYKAMFLTKDKLFQMLL